MTRTIYTIKTDTVRFKTADRRTVERWKGRGAIIKAETRRVHR